MLTRDLLRLSFHNLLLHKIRSLLTSLGIIFGVGSVISMLAISEGAKKQALETISAMGIDKIIVFSKEPPLVGKDESASNNASFFKQYGLTVQDYKHINKFENVENIIPMRDARRKMLKGTKRLDLKIVSTTIPFLDETKCELIEGRWFNPIDMANKSLVCVVGKNVKRKLFSLGQGSIVGQQIPSETVVYTVIGVIENNLGTQFPEVKSPNDMIIIPQTTSEAIYGFNAMIREGRRGEEIRVEFDILIVKVKDIEFIDNTAKRITAYLQNTHEATKDWGMRVPLDLLKQKEQTQNIFTIVMGSIAGISLIVGGIGIMNIMLANVYERRKEIGTRRALGAKKKDILFQFLMETVFLTLLGGILGIILGVGISNLVTFYAKWPVEFSYSSIGLSITISGIVGIVFGTYPAWKAAQQNVIDVLRTE